MKETFKFQESLPIQPIPDLEETCNKFIEWVEPLLTEEEFNHTKEIVRDFNRENGEGKRLQQQLITWAKGNKLANWTAPLWYDIYLKARYSLVINSNVFYLLEQGEETTKLSQAHTAAAVSLLAFRFKALIDTETLKPDLQKGEPLCMDQYRKLFSATRIPKLQADELRLVDSQKHIVVLYKGSLFSLDILTDEGCIRSFLEIKKDIESILSFSVNIKGQNIPVLTTLPRNEWTEGREALLNVHPNNEEVMTKIEDAVFTLCLDDESPTVLHEASKMLLHGNGNNRWVDKSLQFIIFKNGRIGINIEHTGIDGSPMTRLIRFIYDNIHTISKEGETAIPQRPKPLEFQLNAEIEKLIEDGFDRFAKHIDDTQIRILIFDKFGKERIKAFKVSPDAFIQLALQLAEYKLFGKCYSAYEAIMTRMFLEGRIDVLYGVSLESMEFIKSMMNPNCDDETKVNNLIVAAKKHVDRANECRTGGGVVTHLFGLLTMYELYGKDMGIENIPKVFTDQGYKKLNHSVVCTSTSATHGIELAGYGPVVDDGFGIRYLNKENAIHFNMTSRTAIRENLDRMLVYIEESLVEMAEVMEKSNSLI